MDEKVIKKIITRAKRIVKLEDEIETLIDEMGEFGSEKFALMRANMQVDHWNIPKLKAMFPDMTIKVEETGTTNLYHINMVVDGVPFYEFTIGDYAKEFMNE